ncbi:MAG: hypothetical protein J0H29_06375 [Sphingobacteriales bacterium]|nr:hypothetical protein [Sphingobacteriales bacterium]OJY90151.1 MAG: hypothetical protein BGP14_10665 [Sphingobacteriales bacterium 44-15]
MKNNIIASAIAAFFAMAALTACSSSKNMTQAIPAVPTEGDNMITYQDFYDGLSPYGTWIDYPGYGHVWSPRLGADFRPYATNGHWLYSNEGWAWASDYGWGWAPFHYGRWIYDDTYGWLWIPGYEWSPAWVTWGYVDNYYCWAPLMPGVNVGVAFGSWIPHPIYWNVVERSHIYDHNIGTLLQRPEVVNNIQNHITVINNFSNTAIHNQFYSRGPQVNEVEKYTNRQIVITPLHNVPNSTLAKQENNRLNVYRPQVQHAQPREFRRIDNATTLHPVQSAGENPVGQRKEQMDNINRLPVHTVPAGALGGFRRDNRRR